MIHLIDLINEELALESKASEEAERLGLDYMSFGRYGKGGKVTHKSVGGKLQPIAGDSTKMSGQPTKNKTPAPPGRSKQGKTSTPPQKKIASQAAIDLGKKIAEHFSETASPSETASIVTRGFGRTTPITVREKSFLETLKFKAQLLGQNIEVMGFYDPKTDTIVVKNNTPVNTNLRKISRKDAEHLHIQIHESIHAASPRLQGRTEPDSPVDQTIEEGLTEALTRRTIKSMADAQGVKSTPYILSPYQSFEDAIEYIAENEGIELDELFQIPTSKKLRKKVSDMAKNLITKQLSIAFSEKQIQLIIDQFNSSTKKTQEAHDVDWGIILFAKNIRIVQIMKSISPTAKSQARILRALTMEQDTINQIIQAGERK